MGQLLILHGSFLGASPTLQAVRCGLLLQRHYAHWRHLANTTERSAHGNDTAKLRWPLVFIGDVEIEKP